MNFQACTVSSVLNSGTLIKLPKSQLWQEYSLAEDLISVLLWSVTRSSYALKQLVDGVPGRTLEPSKTWQSGTIRLRPSLSLEAPDNALAVDLMTGERLGARGLVLPDVAVVQSDKSLLCRVPIRVEDLMQSRKEQIRKYTPDIEILMEPVSAEFLEPGSDWQLGVIQLGLDLQLIPGEQFSHNGQPEQLPVQFSLSALLPHDDLWQ